MRVLGLVPARGGSRGVPRKNIRLLGGKPLLWYTAQAARQAQRLTRIVLSTDDEEIAEIGRRAGLEVPFLRPQDLAQDDTPMLPVVRHALEFVEAGGEPYDAVCLLQPTNPLREPQDIDGCIQLLWETRADAVITTLPVPYEYNPHWVYFTEPDGRLRLSTGEAAPVPARQGLPPAVHREGSVYVSRRANIVEHGTLYGSHLVGYPIHPSRSINIDGPDDWALAERLVSLFGAPLVAG
jgi:CMP-N,N'-diacetyllegionaminic acid synthase